MALELTIDSVETTDATPTQAPFRLSGKAGKDTAVVKFTPSFAGALRPGVGVRPRVGLRPGVGGSQDIVAHRVRLGGVDAETGYLVEEVVAQSGSGVQRTTEVTFAEFGGATDGDQSLNIYVQTADGIWR